MPRPTTTLLAARRSAYRIVSIGSMNDGSDGTATSAVALSWCDDCARGGNCSSPSGFEAKYCGAWRNETTQANASCCCNLSWTCRLSATSCDCVTPAVDYPGSESPPPDIGLTKALAQIAIWVAVGLLAIVLLCCCGCYYGWRKDKNRQARRRAVAR